MSEQTSIQVTGSHVPIGYGVGQVHVSFHHNGLTVVGRMVSSNRVDQWAVAYKPVFFDVAAKVKRFVVQVIERG